MSKLGIKARIYRNTGTYNAPNWVAINKVSDLTVNASWDRGEANTRESRIKKSAKTLLGLSISGKVQVSNTDAGYIALHDAAHSDAALDLLILNGPLDENGSRGYRGYFQVHDPNEDQALGNVLYMDFVLEPAQADVEIKKAVVTGGAPTYTDIAV